MKKVLISQLGAMPNGAPLGNVPNMGRQRGSSADYNGNNTWYFNGNNGVLNNNNRYNGNFRSRPVLDYDQYDNSNLDTYLVPLSEWLIISMMSAKGKYNKPTYSHFRLHRIERLVRLAHEVNNFELMPTESTAHIIFEPRVREIVCACASKRIVQTFYIRTLQPMLEQYMYHPDSYSCRVGKGSLRAIEQLQDYIFIASEGYTRDCWIAKVDIQAFFMSLDCFDLCDTVTKFIEKHMAGNPLRDLMIYLTRQIYLASTKDHLLDMAHPSERELLNPQKSLYNQPYYQGVPIGDWTSQTAGLIKTTGVIIYLVSLGYMPVHYTDDTTTPVVDKVQWLKEDLWRLENFYKMQGLTLHPNKRYFQHHSKGVEVLGFKLRFNRILPSDRIYHNIMWYLERTTRRAAADFSFALLHKEQILSTVNSYLGMLRHMTAYKLRRKICTIVEESALTAIFEPAEDYTKLVIRPSYTEKVRYKAAYRELKRQYKLAA